MRVADPGEALFTSTVECGRGESGRGWQDGIRRGLSWGYPFVGFGCGDVDTGLRDISSRSACSGASGGGAEWRDERCCSAGRVNADPRGALGSGSEFVRTREWVVVGFGASACFVNGCESISAVQWTVTFALMGHPHLYAGQLGKIVVTSPQNAVRIGWEYHMPEAPV